MLTEIEAYIGQPVHVLEITKRDYQYTLEFTRDTDNDWQSLIEQAEKMTGQRKKKK
jgi:ATP-dependent RNA helicase RhlE